MSLENEGASPEATLSDSAAILTTLVAILLIIFGITLNGLYASLTYGAWIMIPIYILAAIGIGWKALKKKPIELVFGAVVTYLMGLALYGGWASAGFLYTKFVNMQFGARSAVIGTIVVFGLATILFAFRYHYRFYYGATEILAGLAICAYRFSVDFAPEKAANPDFYFAILTAAVYIIVRGWDNVQQGLAEERKAPLVGEIVKHILRRLAHKGSRPS